MRTFAQALAKNDGSPMSEEGVNTVLTPFYMAIHRLSLGQLTPPEFNVLNEYMMATWYAAKYHFELTPEGSQVALDSRDKAEFCAKALQMLADRFASLGGRFTCTTTELSALRACCVIWDRYVTGLPSGVIMRVLMDAANSFEQSGRMAVQKSSSRI